MGGGGQCAGRRRLMGAWSATSSGEGEKQLDTVVGGPVLDAGESAQACRTHPRPCNQRSRLLIPDRGKSFWRLGAESVLVARTRLK